MKLSSIGTAVMIGLLVAGVFFAGCSDNSDTSKTDTAATQGVTTTVAAAGAQYSAGDIVKNPKSSANTGLLIIGYDAGTDMYERAYIYPNKDGSWGYRLDSKTAKVSRASTEKVYTEKVSTIDVSAVPVGTPTKTVTATSTPTTRTTTVATTTATTAAVSAPKVTDISPDSGKTGTTVTITELEGQYFREGAKVSLKKPGENSIAATDVDVVSSVLIECSFVIPSGAQTGYWSVVVTNPDGQYHEFQNGFNILQGTATATTTTAAGTSGGNITIYSLSPSSQYTGGFAYPNLVIDVSGTNLGAGTKATLTQGSTTIPSTAYAVPSTMSARVFFDIPAGSTGSWRFSILDSNGATLGSLANALTLL